MKADWDQVERNVEKLCRSYEDLIDRYNHLRTSSQWMFAIMWLGGFVMGITVARAWWSL